MIQDFVYRFLIHSKFEPRLKDRVKDIHMLIVTFHCKMTQWSFPEME